MGVEPIITERARKRDISDDEILHADRQWIHEYEEGDGLIMLIGPTQSVQLLEIGVVTSADRTPVIVHAMQARQKYLR